MILILDNYDSFSHNLLHAFEVLGQKVQLRQNNQIDLAGIEQLNPKAIVLSAGPGTPLQAGILLQAIARFLGKIPLLGVCLGHQALGLAAGAELARSKNPVHGLPVPLKIETSTLFQGLNNPFFAARYNSLVLTDCPAGYHVTAWSAEGEIMAMEHDQRFAFGVQFHPESFMTKQGPQILRNFLHALNPL